MNDDELTKILTDLYEAGKSEEAELHGEGYTLPEDMTVDKAKAAILAHYAKLEKVNSSDEAPAEPQHIDCMSCDRQNVPDWDGQGHCISCARDTLQIQPVFTLTGEQLTMLRESKYRKHTVLEGKGIESVRVNRDQLAAILDLRPMGEIKPGYWLTREGPYITDEQLDALAALVNNDERKCDES